jgi:hypothetical protein
VRPPSWPDDEDDGDSDADYEEDQMGTPLLDTASFGSSPPVTPRVVSAPSSWTLAGAASVNGGTPGGSSGSGGSSRGVPLTEVCHPQQHHANGGGSESWARRMLDLREYTNRSNVSVPESFSAQRTYLLFRTLGLRHLPVRAAHASSVFSRCRQFFNSHHHVALGRAGCG